MASPFIRESMRPACDNFTIPGSNRRPWRLLLAAWIVASPVPHLSAASEPVDFNRDVLPVLSANCFECHGPDAGSREAELRLDDRDNAILNRDGHAALGPGEPDRSELIARITAPDPLDVMPPPKSGERLTPEQIRMLRDWIEQGAEYSGHWAFEPPRRPELPAVRDTSWVQSPVDRFVLHRLEQEGMQPGPRASRDALIRRATLDLTGLPPSPEELEAFLADSSPKAYARLIDRLLASITHI
jgi:mono/diheme cytochrome c family protein